MGYESEWAAGFDHDARHGDRYERQTIGDAGPATGLSGRNRGGFLRRNQRKSRGQR